MYSRQDQMSEASTQRKLIFSPSASKSLFRFGISRRFDFFTCTMKLSFALTNLLLSVSFVLSNGDGPATWVREKLEEGIALNGMGGMLNDTWITIDIVLEFDVLYIAYFDY